MRIAVAGFMHESNTFNPLRTDRAAFEAQCLKFGDSFVNEWRDAHHEVGAFIKAAENRFELLPVGMAWATPSGKVTDDIFDEVTSTFCNTLRREPCDGLLLAVHGAMVAESYPDADGEILRRIRQSVGPNLPIVVTFDLHANLTQQMIDNCTAAVTYRTNPHVDQQQCGLRAVDLLHRILTREIKPCQALAKPPVIISLAVQDTSREPLRPFFRELNQLEESKTVLRASFALGFPYADVPQMGPSILIVTDGDQDAANRIAKEQAQKIWDQREKMVAALPNAKNAVRKALDSAKPPVVLVDFGDNVGGGSAADGTILLQELLHQKATDAIVCIFDPDSVERCLRAGIGNEVTLTVGGKVDRLHGDPVDVHGRVRVLHDGIYVESDVRHGGKRVNNMGTSALVELEGRNLLVLNSLRHPPFSLGQLTALGIDPRQQRILVVKAAIAYKAAYAPVAGTIIEVDTPGLTAVNPARFDYKHIRRPMYPLDHTSG